MILKNCRLSGYLLAYIFILIFMTAFSGFIWSKEPFEDGPQKFGIDNFAGSQPINLDDVLSTAAPDDEIPVIIRFKSKFMDADYDQLEQKIGKYETKQRFNIIRGMAGKLTKKQIEELKKNPALEHIEYDTPVYACLNTATLWFGTDDVNTDFGLTGSGVAIAIIDTGIDAGHVDLDGGKVIGWKDYVNKRTTPYDDDGHGTHVSSIAAGAGDGNPIYKGVAPGASLVGVKVLDSKGSGSSSNVIAGVEWCVTNKNTFNPPIKVINLSLGSGGSSSGTDSLCVACNNAMDAGLVVVVAAGNDGPDKYTIGSPAASAKAITVGAMADAGERGFFQAYFSSRGPTADNRIKPDISAPGWNIMAAEAGTESSYVELYGTSMASPFVAGVAALMLQNDSSLTPSQVKSQIMNTAQDWATPGPDIDYGAGRLDAYKAISGTISKPTVPSHYYISDSLSVTNTSDDWYINVTNTSYPIAATVIMTNWPSYDFYVNLYNPSGTIVDYSRDSLRQETILYSPTSTGVYKLRVYSSSGSGPYFFDLSAGVPGGNSLIPETTISLAGTSGANEWYTSNVTVTLTAIDGDSGIDKTEYSFNGTAWNTYTDPFTVSTEGTTTVYYRSKDKAGNVETPKNQSFKIDKTSPVSVSDLTASNQTKSTAKLTWTAPLDAMSGTASYDIRYSTANITDANWNGATQCTGEPTPETAGTSQNLVVSGLIPNTMYYFVLKTSDNASNVSGLSNVPSQKTTATTANDQSVTTNEDTAANITLTASDTDGDTITYSVVTQPINGTLSGTPPNLIYTPKPNYVGPDNVSDSFTFKASAGGFDSNTATVSVTVTPVIRSAAINLSSGWNMLSCSGNPVVSDIATIVTGKKVFPFAYTYNPLTNTFDKVYTIEFGKSYWFVADGNTQITLEYYQRQSLTYPLKKGWNMSGSLSYDVPTSSLTTTPPNQIFTFVYCWNPVTQAFYKAYTIKPGDGYYIAANSDCTLTMNCGSSPAPPSPQTASKEKPSWEGIASVYTQKENADMLYDSLIPPLPESIDIINTDFVNDLPKKTNLLVNYPNPFNPETWIPYELSKNTKVEIMIYSSTGQLVRRLDLGHKLAGRYITSSTSAYWDGKNESGEIVSSGVYFYTLVTPDFSQTRKLVIVR